MMKYNATDNNGYAHFAHAQRFYIKHLFHFLPHFCLIFVKIRIHIESAFIFYGEWKARMKLSIYLI